MTTDSDDNSVRARRRHTTYVRPGPTAASFIGSISNFMRSTRSFSALSEAFVSRPVRHEHTTATNIFFF